MKDFDAKAGRFIPASEVDFNRYAKNLAWLLDEPLSVAKEALAQLYGFSSCHELKQVLTQGLPPGPFSQAPYIPSFLGEPPVESGPDCLARTDIRYAARKEKLWWVYWGRDGSQMQPRRLLAMNEAGFYCSPKVHKALFRRVQAGLQAFESGDPAKAREWLEKDWPIGYWSVLDLLYEKDLNIDSSGYAKLTRVRGVNPADAYQELWQFKAARIYSIIVDGIPAALEFEPILFDDVEPPRKTESGLGLFDFSISTDWEVRFGLDRFFAESEEADFMALLEALSAGDYDLSKHRQLREQCLPEEMADIAAGLRASRYAELKCFADEIDGRHCLVEELLESSASWPLRKSPLMMAEFAKTHPGEKIPQDIIAHHLQETDNLETYVSLWPYEGAYEFEESCVQVLGLNASFFHSKETATGSNNQLIGCMDGYLLVPFNDEYACNDVGWFDALDSCSAMLSDVWKVLQVDYFPSQGMHSIEEFTTDRPFKSIAVTNIELLPEYRGLGLTPHLFKGVQEAIAEREYNAVDADWFALTALLSFQQEEVEELDPLPPRAGATPLGEPVVFVIPIEGAEPEDRIIRPQLNRSLVRKRKDPRDAKERQKRKLMAHFKAMEPALVDNFYNGNTIHLVCYDPHEWPAT